MHPIDSPTPPEARGPAAGSVAAARERRREQRRERGRSATAPSLKRRFRMARRRVGKSLLPMVAPSILRRLSASWMIEFHDRHHLERAFADRGQLAAVWHGRMLVGMPAHQDLGYKVLVSPSDDGSLITQLLLRFGFGVIRGSSNKGASRAMREMLIALREGGCVVVTPDGPRGPRHSMNPGLAWMAKVTGFPVIPCGMAADRAWHMRSWDRFTIPKWGARAAVVYGEPLWVPGDADDATLEAATEEVRVRLIDAERKGFESLGAEPDW